VPLAIRLSRAGSRCNSKPLRPSEKQDVTGGVRINIDVLNAQRQLYSIRRDLARARYDTIMNGLRLKAASGSLREDDLVPVNNLLQK
jgi:outer membrane protein